MLRKLALTAGASIAIGLGAAALLDVRLPDGLRKDGASTIAEHIELWRCQNAVRDHFAEIVLEGAILARDNPFALGLLAAMARGGELRLEAELPRLGLEGCRYALRTLAEQKATRAASQATVRAAKSSSGAR